MYPLSVFPLSISATDYPAPIKNSFINGGEKKEHNKSSRTSVTSFSLIFKLNSVDFIVLSRVSTPANAHLTILPAAAAFSPQIWTMEQ
jgi:hypothetical protein